MELVVVTWGFRITFLALAGVTFASIASGASLIDAALRGVAVALVFTYVTRMLLDRLEPPERRLARLRAKRAAGREKAEKKGKLAAAREAADGAANDRGDRRPAAGIATAAARGRAA